MVLALVLDDYTPVPDTVLLNSWKPGRRMTEYRKSRAILQARISVRSSTTDLFKGLVGLGLPHLGKALPDKHESTSVGRRTTRLPPPLLSVGFLGLIYLGLIVPRDGTATVQSDLEARFRAEYPAAVEKLTQSYSNVRCRGKSKLEEFKAVDGILKPSEAEEKQIECLVRRGQAGFSFLDQTTFLDHNSGRGWGQVRCETPKYHFVLSRSYLQDVSESDQTLGWSSWSVLTFGEPMRKKFGARSTSLVFMPFRDDMVFLEDLPTDPNFKVVEGREFVRDGETLVELGYLRSEDERNMAIVPRKIVFQPRLNWALVEHEFSQGVDGQVVFRKTTSFEYQEYETGLVFPKAIHAKYQHWGQDGMDTELSISSVDFEEISFDPVSDDEFTLGAFGLPENPFAPAPDSRPAGPGPRTYPPIWAIAAVVGLVIVALVYQRRMASKKDVSNRGS